MRGHGTKFGRKKEEAVAALLTQRSIDEAAKATGIAANTLLKWMKDPDFQEVYREARREAFGQCIARLQYASSAAVSVMLKILADPSAPASARLRAADMIVTHSAKAIEIDDVEARVSALEASVAAERGVGRK
jgi:hypothetical protein